MNIAFIYALGQAMQWPDIDFVGDQFMRGVSNVGIGREVHLWKRERSRKMGSAKGRDDAFALVLEKSRGNNREG